VDSQCLQNGPETSYAQLEVKVSSRKILDHGYVSFVESWGSDERIVEAARMSTGKGFLGWGPVHQPTCAKLNPPANTFGTWDPNCSCEPQSGDEKLLRFLWDNKHATPFEMAGLIVEVQAPIFVFREWHRHRTQSYNEMSARYTPLPNVNYVPTIERLMVNASTTNKQAGTIKGADDLTEYRAEVFRQNLAEVYERAEALYQEALAQGVPKELARVHLPVGRYSRMRASMNLRNALAFITLRSAPAAQFEIRQYSDAVGALIAEAFPRTWAIFNEELS
jgi:thymidylate synthase (FAD)